jgi:ankyrin repeat protein
MMKPIRMLRLLVIAVAAMQFSAHIRAAPADDIVDAVKRCDLERVRSLLKNNPDLASSTNVSGMTPLHWAASQLHRKEIVELLLANKADVNATNKFNQTPLYFAAYSGDSEVAAMLLQRNAYINARGGNGSTPLAVAVSYGHGKVAELLLKSNAAVELKDAYGNSPLRHAVHTRFIGMTERVAMVKLLLSYNADVNSRDNYGSAPLAHAEGTEIAKLLIANKADVNARDDLSGATPLHSAAAMRSKDLTEVLLANNADINAGDKRGCTPLHTAVERGSKAVVELLLANKADVNAKDNGGNTPLQSGFYNKEIALLLRQHGGHGKEVTTKPLVGWYLDGDADSHHHQAIIDDHKNFVEMLKKKYPHLWVAEVHYYEDGTGQHAVKLTIETAMRDYKEFYLIYDQVNVRTKVIKGKSWHQFHM